MNRERARELANSAMSWKAWGWREGRWGAIADVILAAVAEEREACAKIAEEDYADIGGHSVAQGIRARAILECEAKPRP